MVLIYPMLNLIVSLFCEQERTQFIELIIQHLCLLVSEQLNSIFNLYKHDTGHFKEVLTAAKIFAPQFTQEEGNRVVECLLHCTNNKRYTEFNLQYTELLRYLIVNDKVSASFKEQIDDMPKKSLTMERLNIVVKQWQEVVNNEFDSTLSLRKST